MGDGKRSNSVTDLLQGSVDLYVPLSPSHHQAPDRDCWVEPRSSSKHEKDKAAHTTLDSIISVGDLKTNSNAQGKVSIEEKVVAKDQLYNYSQGPFAKSQTQSKAEVEARTLKEKNKIDIKTRKTKIGNGSNEVNSRGTEAEKVKLGLKSEKKTLQGYKMVSREQDLGENNSLLPLQRPRPGV